MTDHEIRVQIARLHRLQRQVWELSFVTHDVTVPLGTIHDMLSDLPASTGPCEVCGLPVHEECIAAHGVAA